MYKIHKIPKRNGGVRVIYEPEPELKETQKAILKMLMGMRPTLGPYAHGFVRWRSIVTNAKKHFDFDPIQDKMVPCNCLLKVDLSNFFESVTPKMVDKAAVIWKIPPYLRREIGRNCFIKVSKEELKRRETLRKKLGMSGDWWKNCLNLGLPQGAPTSPFLANLAGSLMDFRIAGLLKKWRINSRYQDIHFSRYADDLAFSSNYPRLIDMLHALRGIIGKCGFGVNERKIEFHRQPARMMICGVIINDKPGPKREYWRKIRAVIHNAVTDIESGLSEPGFCLDPAVRKKVKEVAGLNGKTGLVKAADLPGEALTLAEESEKHEIPWNSIEGQISFVGSIDKEKGMRLQTDLEELRRVCKL